MQRLIVGCGRHYQRVAGDVTLDVRPFPGVDHVWDLNAAPWPFDDASFGHINATHVVEHLRDLVSFMNEAWRILLPGGTLYIETPLAGADVDLEFCDPTHVRCYRVHTFHNYFSMEGVERFGYTDRAWNFFHLQARELNPGRGDFCIYAHATPVKR